MSFAAQFTVETSPEKALVVGGPSIFADYLLAKLKDAGVEVVKIKESEIGEDLLSDLDIYVTFNSKLPVLPASVRIYQFLPYADKSSVTLTSSPSLYRCYYGDFLGSEYSYSPLLEEYLAECRDHKRLTIPGDGLAEYHLLHLQDVLEGFNSLLFASNPSRETVLVNPESISLLSLGYQIRSLLPYKIDIRFAEERVWPEPDYIWPEIDLAQSKINWQPHFNYQTLLSQFIDSFFAHTPFKVPKINRPPLEAKAVIPESVIQVATTAPVFVPLSRPPSRPKLQPLKRPEFKVKLARPQFPAPIRIISSSLFIAFTLYIFSIFISAYAVSLGISKLSAKSEGELLQNSISPGLTSFPAVYLQANLSVLASLPGFRNSSTLTDLNRLNNTYLLSLETISSVNKLASSVKQITGYVLADQDLDIASALSNARLDADEFYQKLSLLDGSLNDVTPDILPVKYSDRYQSLKQQIQETKRYALTGKSLLTVAPEILGVGSRRKYAILFQNNMELRATGGFIGSFGILSLENGKLFDVQVYDVYAADGQLKGHVEPPAEIKKYLGEANWFLRDSNWDPDFPTSARRAEWFLGKTISQDVQGTIGINLNTLQDILNALGPVRVADYDEEISATNLFERAEYHAEVNFFPGSTAKKEFIASVADTLLAQLGSLEGEEALSLTRALIKSIDEKNTLIALADSAVDSTLSTLGWNGELRQITCPNLIMAINDQPGNCVSDYAMLVDSNFGVNKANYFIDRRIDLDITVSQDLSVGHKLRVVYKNSATSSAWPAGPYKNYSRLYLPVDTIVSSVTIGDRVLPKEELSITSEHGRIIAGFLVEVPLDSQTEVIVEYMHPKSVAAIGSTYTFFWQKQPGTAADPLNIAFSYPGSLVPEIVSPQASLSELKLDFSLSNITDRRITVKFK